MKSFEPNGAEQKARRGGLRSALRDFFYGMVGLEFERHEVEMRASLEMIFMAVTFGDLLGLPVIPPLYSLRLLPYVVPNISTWKRRAMREREFSDSDEFDLHGILFSRRLQYSINWVSSLRVGLHLLQADEAISGLLVHSSIRW